VREDGNDGAHDGTLGKEDAEDLLDFTTALLERIYTEPERLRLAQERREKRRLVTPDRDAVPVGGDPMFQRRIVEVAEVGKHLRQRGSLRPVRLDAVAIAQDHDLPPSASVNSQTFLARFC
jgi:hypothetical protein